MGRSDKYVRVWSPGASKDLIGIWEHFAGAASAARGDDVLRAIDRATAALEDWPEIGKARDDVRPGLRSVRAERHVVFYCVGKGIVEIVRVLDERRDVDAIFSDGD